MSNFDNFDIHQMSPKFAQRWLFVCNFYCIKISFLGSLDYAKNAKRQFFLDTRYKVQSTYKVRVFHNANTRFFLYKHKVHKHAQPQIGRILSTLLSTAPASDLVVDI